LILVFVRKKGKKTTGYVLMPNLRLKDIPSSRRLMGGTRLLSLNVLGVLEVRGREDSLGGLRREVDSLVATTVPENQRCLLWG
jgi:hypothetical protein